MQPDLWTLNRLALELGRDRRALGRDLEGLKPAESIRKGNRTERKWRLRDVVEHLYAQRPADDAEHAFENERERLAAAQADKYEMENALRRNELAEVAAVHAVWTDHIAAARAKLLAMPSKLGPQLTNVADARILSSRIRAEVTAALAELADYEPPEASGEPAGADSEGGGSVGAAARPDGQRVGRRKKAAQ